MQLQDSSVKRNQVSPQQAIENWLVSQLANQLSLDAKTINVTEPLTRYGLDSIDAVTMVGDLEEWLDLELPSTLFWDHPTIAKSAQFLADNYEISAQVQEAQTEVKPQPQAPEVPTHNGNKGWGGLFGRR
jgi:acyl carrier protein